MKINQLTSRSTLLCLTLAFFLTTLNAIAAPEALLEWKVVMNGAKPRDSYQIRCSISKDGKVTEVGLGAMIDPTPSQKNIVWTHSIASTDEILKLVKAAEEDAVYVTHRIKSSAKLNRLVLSISSFTETGAKKGVATLLKEKIESIVTKENSSTAAKQLIEFVELNCAPRPLHSPGVSGNN